MCVCRCCTVKGKRLELSTPKLVEVYVVVHGMMVAPRHACSDGIMGAPAPSQGVSALPPCEEKAIVGDVGNGQTLFLMNL